ncbi:MAG: ABC transporter permease [Ilumatobacteraceae bacterium]
MTEILIPDVSAEYTPDAAEGLTATSMSPRKMAYKRYMRHKGAVVCTAVMIVLLVIVIFAPLTMRYGVNEAVFPISEGPNQYLSPRGIAWLGTDDIGRDVYSRLIAGLRVSLVIGLAAAIFSTIIGVTLGSVAGLRGGAFDDILMRVTDVFLAFPFLVALLVVRAFLGGIGWLETWIGKPSSIRFVIVLFVLFGWMGVARLVRGQVLSLKEREFIEATRALGATNRRIIFKHLLPNSVGPVLVALTTSVVAAVVGEATLSFFGFGPQPGAGATSLGNLVREADLALVTGNWWLAVFPCALLTVVAVCINFIGDGLRDATDPKLPGGAN